MGSKTYLENLIGKALISTSITTNTILPINGNGKELFTIANSLNFEDFRLDINNPISINPSEKQLNDLIGLKVIAVNENSDEAELLFTCDIKLVVNLRDEAYYDPEAMVLYGPNNFCAVWN